MKKIRPILGVSLIIQSITFLVLCLVNIEKKKALAKTFGVFSAVGGVAGVALLVIEFRNRKKSKKAEAELYDEFSDDFDDFDIEEDELLCTFEGVGEDEDDAE